ncbi:MAG: tetratricopeptide repeat protein, partial [Geobacteraceae bacterium]|nr:tetratricopeptide repeat protein [Geobacteraceae bacterium]
GEVDKAITHYEKVAAYYAEHAFYLKAIAVYKQMQRLAPDNDAFTFKLAKLNEQQGLVGNALAEYRTLLKHYESNENIRAAIDTLGQIRELDPDNVNAAVKLANYYAQSGEKDSAHQTFAQVEKQLWKKGNYKQLQSFYEHFMKLWPEDVYIMAQYGQAMVEFGEPIGGVEYLERLYREYPKQIPVLDRLAAGLHKNKEYEREISCLQKWTEMEPDNLDAHLRLCEAALETDNPETCFAALEKSREKFFAAERVLEIKPIYERLREVLPQNRDVVTALRSVYEHLGEGEKLFDTLGGFESDSEEFNNGQESTSEKVSAHDSFASASADTDNAFNEVEFDDITFDTVDDDQQEQLDIDSFEMEDATPRKSVDISTELEEVDFYLQQGLLDEAQEACESLLEHAPGNAGVEQRLDRIEQFRKRHEEQIQESTTQTATDTPDKNTPIEQVVPETHASLEALLSEKEARDDDTMQEFDLSLGDDFDLDLEVPELADSQRGVETEIGDEDTESAYNLGIAYKEMGLYSDAVEQFRKAKDDAARRVSSISLQAECYRSVQQYEKAEEVLTDGLSASDLSMDERIVLYYETGLLYEDCDRPADALASFQVVEDKKPHFREVAKKVAELKKILGFEDGSDNHSRVSYV